MVRVRLIRVGSDGVHTTILKTAKRWEQRLLQTSRRRRRRHGCIARNAEKLETKKMGPMNWADQQRAANGVGRLRSGVRLKAAQVRSMELRFCVTELDAAVAAVGWRAFES
jgi:hypothetical protein